MSICDNTTVNQETPLKLHLMQKQKHVAILAKKLSMTLELDEVPRYFIKKVSVLKKYRGTLVHGTAHYCLLEVTWLYDNYIASLIIRTLFIRPLYFVRYILVHYSNRAYHSRGEPPTVRLCVLFFYCCVK